MGLFDRFKKKSTSEPEPAEPDATTIVPRIKNVAFLEALKEHGVPQDQMPHTEPFAADLLVTYAFDLPEIFQMVMAHDLRRLALDSRQLRDIAVTNLRREIREIGRGGEPPLMQAVVGGDLEACVLLLDEFWQKLEGKVPGEIVVAVPARHVVLITGSESDEGLQLMRQRTAEDFAAGGNHSLTQSLLVRRNGSWAVFEEGTHFNSGTSSGTRAAGQSSLFDQDIPDEVMQRMVKASALFAVRQEHWDEVAATDRIVEWGYHQDDAILHLKYDDGSNRAFRAQILGSFHPERMEWEWSWNNPHCDAHLSTFATKAKAFGDGHGVEYLRQGMVPVPETSAVAYLLSLAVGFSDAQATFEADAGQVSVFLGIEGEVPA
jgi:uncharacterized protein YtpQ (UPF0354 family)